MKIKEDFEIKTLTTYKIGGKVKKVYFPETQDEFSELLRELDEYIVLGGVSNVLFSSNGYSGNLIFTTEMKNFEINENKVIADCGVKAPLIAQKVCEHSLTGLEFLIGLPGTIGGAVYMNAGAHSQAISDTLVSCTLLDKETKEVVYKQNSELEFGYRKSVLQQGRYVLLSAEFELKKAPQEEIKNLMAENLNFRKSIQPSLAYPNAGSVFKNPENDSAGRLLDKAGVKEINLDHVSAGHLSGSSNASQNTFTPVMIWDKHANFIVNKGGATSEDVLELMVMMRNKVKEMFNIELIPEQIFLGDMSEKEEELCNILYQKSQK